MKRKANPTDAATARAATATATATNDRRWAALLARDKGADGTFYYSVATTGVYCRPSCGARLPRRQNVQFHATTADAERAGFRACLRCRPSGLPIDARNAAKVARACRLIEGADELPTLDELARHAGMSPFHLHRTFKAVTGVTPREYGRAQRARRVRRGLGTSATVTAAIYDAGFGSNSRFYEAADALLGMTPTAFRDGGAAMTVRYTIADCALGALLVGRSERGVCAILLGDDAGALERQLREQFPKATRVRDTSGYEAMVAQVVATIERPGTRLELPLDIRGTAFQQRVWKALQQIPVGSTATYADIARAIGSPKAVRAVAQACGANALAVAIPCHRVIRGDGALSGYRWGSERKRALLEREARR